MIEIDELSAVVLDIEGTTSSLSFVKDTLFPFARQRLSAYVSKHESQLGEILGEVRAILGDPALRAEQITLVMLRWMDEDRKITPLKTLQGLIWQAGYKSGELTGHIYDDAVRALKAWHGGGLKLYIYSSGSIAAQQLLFSHTRHGDLTPYLSAYFDTTTGPKLESASYATIARRAELAPRFLLFLSDHPGEVQAASAAGMQAIRVDRDGAPAGDGSRVVHSFDELALAPRRQA
jgi:enolase-phosphatase E1